MADFVPPVLLDVEARTADAVKNLAGFSGATKDSQAQLDRMAASAKAAGAASEQAAIRAAKVWLGTITDSAARAAAELMEGQRT